MSCLECTADIIEKYFRVFSNNSDSYFWKASDNVEQTAVFKEDEDESQTNGS